MIDLILYQWYDLGVISDIVMISTTMPITGL